MAVDDELHFCKHGGAMCGVPLLRLTASDFPFYPTTPACTLVLTGAEYLIYAIQGKNSRLPIQLYVHSPIRALKQLLPQMLSCVSSPLSATKLTLG